MGKEQEIHCLYPRCEEGIGSVICIYVTAVIEMEPTAFVRGTECNQLTSKEVGYRYFIQMILKVVSLPSPRGGSSDT